MSILSWVSVLSLLAILYSLFLLIPISKRNRSAYLILLSLAIVLYGGSSLTYLIRPNSSVVIRWFNFTSLVFIISSLFAMIRDSKPIFARFPSYLIYLPFVTLLFFPLVVDQTVITNLLLGTFQAGSILVAVMMYSINHIKNGKNLIQLIGVGLFFGALIIFWFTPLNLENKTLISELLVLTGLLILSVGIRKKYQIK